MGEKYQEKRSWLNNGFLDLKALGVVENYLVDSTVSLDGRVWSPQTVLEPGKVAE